MRGRLPGGLRGRLLVAFVLTSALTLAVVSGILLGPLREQLREQSTDNLELAVVQARGQIQAAWDNEFELGNQVRALRQRTDARVLVANSSLTRDDPLNPGEVVSGFQIDTEIGEPPLEARLVALRAQAPGAG